MLNTAVIIIIKVFLKRKILSLETYSMCAHTHTHTHPHTHTHTLTQRHPYTQAFWLYKAKCTQFKNGQQTPGRLGMDEDSTEQKTWQVYNFGKRNVFRLDLNESREDFCRRGREKVIPSWWTEKRKGPRANSGESGAKNLPSSGPHLCRIWPVAEDTIILEMLL